MPVWLTYPVIYGERGHLQSDGYSIYGGVQNVWLELLLQVRKTTLPDSPAEEGVSINHYTEEYDNTSQSL